MKDARPVSVAAGAHAAEDGIARSRRAADRDAVLASVMNGLTDPFMIPYVLALGGTHVQAGWLSSARSTLLAIVQLGSAEAVRRAGSRRRVVLWTAGLQALLWLPIACAPLFGAGAVFAVIGLYTIATASAALGGPAWGSLLADYIDPAERGAYFGRRARLTGFAAGVASLAAGAALHLTEGRGALGFGLLCAAAGVARFFSWSALRHLHDAGPHDEPELETSFADFLRSARRSNFARFSLCLALNSLAAAVAAPFFAVYLLEVGQYSYPVYTAVILAGSITGMLSAPWWGRLGDRAGNHAVLRWTLTGVSVLPALWVVSLHPLWMLGANMLGAFLWGGLNLSASNFVYDAVTPARRHTSIAYFNVLNGIGLGVGAFAGAYLLDAAQSLPAKPFAVLFYASVLLRIAAAVAFGRTVFEVREVRQLGLREVVLDLVGQRLVGVLGFLSVRPEEERPPRHRDGGL